MVAMEVLDVVPVDVSKGERDAFVLTRRGGLHPLALLDQQANLKSHACQD